MRRSVYYSRAGSYSRSYNAMVAEADGRWPMSRAKVQVAAEHGCTQSVAEAALRFLHDGEWHHVGRFASRISYFDTTDDRLGGLIAHIKACGGARKWYTRREELRRRRRDLKLDFSHDDKLAVREPGHFVNRLLRLRREKAG